MLSRVYGLTFLWKCVNFEFDKKATNRKQSERWRKKWKDKGRVREIVR